MKMKKWSRMKHHLNKKRWKPEKDVNDVFTKNPEPEKKIPMEKRTLSTVHVVLFKPPQEIKPKFNVFGFCFSPKMTQNANLL